MKKFSILFVLVFCFCGECFAVDLVDNNMAIESNRYSSSISMKYKGNYFDCIVILNRPNKNLRWLENF